MWRRVAAVGKQIHIKSIPRPFLLNISGRSFWLLDSWSCSKEWDVSASRAYVGKVRGEEKGSRETDRQTDRQTEYRVQVESPRDKPQRTFRIDPSGDYGEAWTAAATAVFTAHGRAD